MYHYFQNTVNISDFAFKAGVINGKLYVLAQHQIPSIMLSDMGFMESGNTEQYSSTGSSNLLQASFFRSSSQPEKMYCKNLSELSLGEQVLLHLFELKYLFLLVK
jgi:hypothetical protein